MADDSAGYREMEAAAMSAPLDLDAIRARCEAATLGPWVWHEYVGRADEWTDRGPWLRNASQTAAWEAYWKADPSGVSPDRPEPPQDVISAWGHDAWGVDVSGEDGDFIAHARQDIPDLLAEVTRLRALCDRVAALERRARATAEAWAEAAKLHDDDDVPLRAAKHMLKTASDELRTWLAGSPQSEKPA